MADANSKPIADLPSLAAAAEGPRWSQIANDLAASIECGRYPDGVTLPSAASVAADYGVHRHTVRQAFRHLQELGLVSVERGRGTIVTGRRFPYRIGRRVSFRTNFNAAGVMTAGEVLKSRIARPDQATSQLLALPPDALVWEIRMMNRAAGAPVSTGIHRLDVARFPDFDQRLVAAGASVSAAFATYGIHEYVRLSTRLTARSASLLEARILGLAPEAPVMQSVAVDGLDDGTPLQAIAGAFAGDRMEFVIEPEE